MDLGDGIVRDPAVCGGQPVFSGTRVLLRTVLGCLARGQSSATILDEFPTLTEAHVRAAIAFAARLASRRIRPVEARDLEAVREVLVETWHYTYDAIMGAARVSEITDSWHSIANLRGEIDRPACAFLLVEAEGAIVATGSASRAEDIVIVHRLYVHPIQQGRGFGTALLDALITHLGPAQQVQLNVAAANTRAIAFYEQRGFAISATDGDDVVMRRGGGLSS